MVGTDVVGDVVGTGVGGSVQSSSSLQVGRPSSQSGQFGQLVEGPLINPPWQLRLRNPSQSVSWGFSEICSVPRMRRSAANAVPNVTSRWLFKIVSEFPPEFLVRSLKPSLTSFGNAVSREVRKSFDITVRYSPISSSLGNALPMAVTSSLLQRVTLPVTWTTLRW